jgi:hypothetical protein
MLEVEFDGGECGGESDGGRNFIREGETGNESGKW